MIRGLLWVHSSGSQDTFRSFGRVNSDFQLFDYSGSKYGSFLSVEIDYSGSNYGSFLSVEIDYLGLNLESFLSVEFDFVG